MRSTKPIYAKYIANSASIAKLKIRMASVAFSPNLNVLFLTVRERNKTHPMIPTNMK